MTTPNFLHLGPGKAGSTWLHEVLSLHPQVYLTEAKDLYFFSRWYERGEDWYLAQFAGAGGQPVIGEVCPDYLPAPEAAKRIYACLGGDAKFMVSLRDPVDRAFSAFLYEAKHGLAAETFRETARRMPKFIDEGRYGTQLARYTDLYPRENIHVSVFDDLQADPQAYLNDVTDFLGIGRQVLAPEDLEAKLAAGQARFVPLARLARRGADWVREHDGARLIGLVKRSSLVQKMLYRPLGDDRPVMDPADAEWVRDQLSDEIDAVEREFGLSLRQRWGWP